MTSNCDYVLSSMRTVDSNCLCIDLQIAEDEGGYCWRIVKNVPVVVPIPELEVAIVQALDYFTRTTLKR